MNRFCALAYLDSNQDKQNQNLSYYHYTIGQSNEIASIPFYGTAKLSNPA